MKDFEYAAFGEMLGSMEQVLEDHVAQQLTVARAEGGKPGTFHLQPKNLDDLHKSKERLERAIGKARPRTGTVKAALLDYLTRLSDAVERHAEDHPDRSGYTFVTETSSKPSFPQLLSVTGRLCVSNQYLLCQETGRVQSQVSQQLSTLEGEGFILKNRVPSALDPSVREQVYRLSGKGIAYCRKEFGEECALRSKYDLSKREHVHHLVTNIVAASPEVTPTTRYVGPGSRPCRIHSTWGGGCFLIPDLIADVHHPRSCASHDVAIEVECSYDKRRILDKAARYLMSPTERVWIVCVEQWMARRYKDHLFDSRRTIVRTGARQTAFEFFHLEKEGSGGARRYVIASEGGGLSIGPP
jgi:hypothetical protein